MKSEDIIKIEKLSDDNSFTIRWNMTYLCNYSCDFCVQGDKNAHIKKSKGESPEIRKMICENLVKFIETKLNKKYDCLYIFLIGGEITILEDFTDIISKIVNCKFDGRINIKMITNLSTNEETLVKLKEIFEQKYEYPRALHIRASFYKEFTTEEEFIKKIKILTPSNNAYKLVNFKIKFKNLKKAFKKLKRSKIASKIENKLGKIYVKIAYPICTDEEYIEYLKFKKKYKNITSDIIFLIIKDYKKSISEKLKKKIVKKEKQDKNIKVTFKNNEVFYCRDNNKISLKLDGEEHFYSHGYVCDVGIKNINIDNLGNVSRCISYKNKTIYGSMKDNNFDLPTEKIICPGNRCSCSFYRVIEKNSEKD